jgi:hypothetical protein
MKKILKSIINFYNTWYGIINAILVLCLFSKIQNTTLLVIIGVIAGVDCYTWYKNIFKNLGTKRELFGTVAQNNAICIYGGTGSGKSTLAQFLLEHFTPTDKRYYNTKVPGAKAFTNEHLLLHEKLENGFGAIVDESGAQVDSYHYDKKDAEARKRIDSLNKFVRQFYGSKSLLLYIDQAQGNQNTSIYRDIYYVIQCKSCEQRPSAILPHYICKFILWFVNKKRPDGKKINNPFTNVAIEYMEFVKLGDYAEHYSINIDDKNHKYLVGSIYKFFGVLDTYVFRDFNPAQESKPYIWGTNALQDKKIMEDNFGLADLKNKVDNYTLNSFNKK